MRLWSIHPKHLDVKGLVALWREALLAKKVLEGKTKSYLHHPQLNRFKKHKKPVHAINSYLICIYDEAKRRGYCFDESRIGKNFSKEKIRISSGQLAYELKHIRNKTKIRDLKKFKELSKIKSPDIHPFFLKVPGKVEDWEKVKR